MNALSIDIARARFLRNACVVHGLIAACVVAGAFAAGRAFLYVALALPAYCLWKAWRASLAHPLRVDLDGDGVTVFWKDGSREYFARAHCRVRAEVSVMRGIEECFLLIQPEDPSEGQGLRIPLPDEDLPAVQRLLEKK